MLLACSRPMSAGVEAVSDFKRWDPCGSMPRHPSGLFDTLSALAPFRIEKVEKQVEPEVVLSMDEEEKLEESV